MKLISITLCLCFFTLNINAQQYTHTGTINRIGAIESRGDADFIFVNGFTSAGECPLVAGFVVARFRTESVRSTFAIALAAKMSNKSITIAVDDAYKNANGYCYIHSIALD